jgi:hypothetical protein
MPSSVSHRRPIHQQVSKLLDDIVKTIASGVKIRRSETNGSIRAVIAHGNIEAVLVKNAGNNTWLLNGWEAKPVASDAANDTSGATLTQADSSDLNVGAGLGDNNAPDIRFSQDVRMLAPSRNVRFRPNRNVRWSAGSCPDRGMLFFGRLVFPIAGFPHVKKLTELCSRARVRESILKNAQ